jgi:hypothetical protein
LHDAEFVDAAYLGLLGRLPDPAGNAHHLDLLRSGKVSQTRLLGELRYSAEGREHNVRVRGLRQAFVMQRFYRVPILGYALGWFAALLRLPMAARDFQQFVAYSHFTERQVAEVANSQAAAAETTLHRYHAVLAGKVDVAQLDAVAGALSADMAGLAPLQSVQDLAHALRVDIAARASRQELTELRQHAGRLDAEQQHSARTSSSAISALRDEIARWPGSLGTLRGELLTYIDAFDVDGLRHRVADVEASVADKAGATQLAELATLSQQIASKADAARVDAAEQRLAAVDKAGAAQLADLATQLSQQIATKADAARVDAAEQRLAAVDKAGAAQLAELATHLSQQIASKADAARVDVAEQLLAAMRESKAESLHLAHLGARLEQLDASKADRERMQHHAENTARRFHEQRRDAHYTQLRLDRLIEQWRSPAVALGATTALSTEAAEPRDLDAFYVAFEDHFRGSRELIRQRALAHIPMLRDASARTGAAQVLDIGCGRGEWLQLLAEQGISAYGVDLNTVMVAECRHKVN